jgi:hypothetical protein
LEKYSYEKLPKMLFVTNAPQTTPPPYLVGRSIVSSRGERSITTGLFIAFSIEFLALFSLSYSNVAAFCVDHKAEDYFSAGHPSFVLC